MNFYPTVPYVAEISVAAWTVYWVVTENAFPWSNIPQNYSKSEVLKSKCWFAKQVRKSKSPLLNLQRPVLAFPDSHACVAKLSASFKCLHSITCRCYTRRPYPLPSCFESVGRESIEQASDLHEYCCCHHCLRIKIGRKHGNRVFELRAWRHSRGSRICGTAGGRWPVTPPELIP